MELTDKQKKKIQKGLIAQFPKGFQNKAAKMAGVSSATISHMINSKWELIDDAMWRKVAVRLRIEMDWNVAETEPLNYLYRHLEAAQMTTQAFMVSAKAGAGKSETYKLFAKKHNNVIYVEYATYWKTKTFVKALCTAAGLDDEGTVEQLLERFIDSICGLYKPIIIIDQFDKMKDSTSDLFIDLYNFLPNSAFCLSGTPALEKKIRRGVAINKTGYHEIWSRGQEKFLKLPLMSLNDTAEICKANGLQDVEEIENIHEIARGDGRIIKKSIKTYFLNNVRNN